MKHNSNTRNKINLERSMDTIIIIISSRTVFESSSIMRNNRDDTYIVHTGAKSQNILDKYRIEHTLCVKILHFKELQI